MTAACAWILAVTLSSAAPPDALTGSDTAPRMAPAHPIATAVASAPALEPAPEAWMLDRKVSRPGALQLLYGTLGALQALDVYSTQRALSRGGSEINPIMKRTAANQAAMIAVKAVSTASSIYFTERTWKKNRKGAVVLMAMVNGVTAAVVARNLKNAR